ncbi:SPFH domain-containing protein [Aureispira anguillae]|uniref:SPFH domain-containing protein n=1 Tax=Aureispira anguillae TaxID=2864201 RepID=A0A915YKY2_9BACT|nr:SPFH domain-containing protein [Aureispira anguillae]BDS14851.1 SPFH domain-containing protein [Aureispira anguillae]
MIGLLIALISVFGWLIWTNAFYQVKEGFAMIRSGLGGQKVYFRGSFLAYPIVHQVTKISISEQRVLVNQTGAFSVRAKDHIRINIQLTFWVQIKHTSWDVLKAAQMIDQEEASFKDMLQNSFEPKLKEAITQVVKTFDYQELYEQQERFKMGLIQYLDEDLGSYQLNRINVVEFKHLPLDAYDVDYDVLDAKGYQNLKKILNQP